MRAVKIQQLTVQYPDASSPVFHRATTDFIRGTVNVVLGSNGTGKTTLFKCITGLHKHYSGNIEVNGEVAYISDQLDHNNYLTLEEHLNFLDQLSQKNTIIDLDELIDHLHLKDLMFRRIVDLSLGEKYKMELMTYLYLGFPIILIDEPLSTLDILCQEYILHQLKHVAREGMTVVLSTHLMKIAYDLANYIHLIHDGQLIQYKNTFPTFEDFKTVVKEKMLHS